MGRATDQDLLQAERAIRGEATLEEATLSNPARLYCGTPDSPVKHIVHFFPHTGFTSKHLDLALERFPETDTIIVSISRVREEHELVTAARQRGLNFIVGNPHSLEILENGLPLACALEQLLPGLEVFLLRERITAVPLKDVGHREIMEYGRQMASRHLAGGHSRVAQI
ncbi:Uncharacterised protein [Mycobacterium tuberculosis]|nr:Uncharacterised protein [Mycobacterium tuberculosis]